MTFIMETLIKNYIRMDRVIYFFMMVASISDNLKKDLLQVEVCTTRIFKQQLRDNGKKEN
jgi:hypothetical protein